MCSAAVLQPLPTVKYLLGQLFFGLLELGGDVAVLGRVVLQLRLGLLQRVAQLGVLVLDALQLVRVDFLK